MIPEAVCAVCRNPLTVTFDNSEDEDATVGASSSTADQKDVPDDILLSCGDHFHWECLMEALSESAPPSDCPSCSKRIVSNGPSGQELLCRLHNEGGVQENLDILPNVVEEMYAAHHPEERKARAFLELCRNGDLPAIIEMLKDTENGDASPQNAPDYFLRYHDPFGSKQSGLHAAVEGKSQEVAWLLLLLASELDLQKFPAAVFQEAAAFGLMRDQVQGMTDIRSFRDAENRTAEELAAQVGPPWHDWLGQGFLAPDLGL